MRLRAHLLYRQHGGSGFGFTDADILELDIAEARFFAKDLVDRRKREEKAIRDASAAARAKR